MTQVREIETPQGPARLHWDRARGAVATVLLSHGAGAGVDTRDLAALAAELPRRGVSVVRLEQPWHVAGRKVASPPPTLDAALRAAVSALRVRTPLILGGRSAGARSACRVAAELGPAVIAGVLALAFPLHPPGKPERSRAEELARPQVPVLVVQGEKDAFGGPAEFSEEFGAPGGIAPIPFADHGFKVAKRAGLSQEAALEMVTAAAGDWLGRWGLDWS